MKRSGKVEPRLGGKQEREQPALEAEKMRRKAMWNMKLLGAFAMALLSLLFLAEGSISAEPPKSQTSSAGRVEQVFVQTNSDSIRVGGWDPAPDNAVLAKMTLNLEYTSLLIITFSVHGATMARASDQSPNSTQPDIACTIDDTTPCQPGSARFLLGNFSTPLSFTWIVPSAGKGKHTISIGATWLPARPGPFSTFFNRTLVVAAAKL